MPYNVSGLANLSSPLGLVSWANTATGDVLFGGLILAVFVIIVVRYAVYGMERALLAASFVCFFIALGLRFAGLLSLLFVLLFMVLMVFMSILVMVRRE